HVSGAGDPRQPERAFGAPWMSTEAIRGWDDVYAQAANPCCPLNPSRYRSSSPGRDGPEGSGSPRRSGLGARHLTILVRWYAKVVRECPRKVRAIAETTFEPDIRQREIRMPHHPGGACHAQCQAIRARRHPHIGEKPPLQLPRTDSQHGSEIGNRFGLCKLLLDQQHRTAHEA